MRLLREEKSDHKGTIGPFDELSEAEAEANKLRAQGVTVYRITGTRSEGQARFGSPWWIESVQDAMQKEMTEAKETAPTKTTETALKILCPFCSAPWTDSLRPGYL